MTEDLWEYRRQLNSMESSSTNVSRKLCTKPCRIKHDVRESTNYKIESWYKMAQERVLPAFSRLHEEKSNVIVVGLFERRKTVKRDRRKAFFYFFSKFRISTLKLFLRR